MNVVKNSGHFYSQSMIDAVCLKRSRVALDWQFSCGASGKRSTVETFAIETLWWMSVALPALVFLTLNPFKNVWMTWLRALVAIACGWAAMFSYALAANAINFSMAKSGTGTR